MAGTIRIGISGWTYDNWRGVFYPKGLARKNELAYAARQFGAIEINGTFYRLQRPESFARWRDASPEGFVFAVKAWRQITHADRLRNVETALSNFFASGLLRLGPKLGPVLWQLPPGLRFDAGLLDAFFAMLPRDTQAAAAMAEHCEDWMEGRRWTTSEMLLPLRHAVEVRHESFVTDRFVALLRRHGVALVCADTPDWPRMTDVTADFAYCRLHGSKKLYSSGYEPAELDAWADHVRDWAQGETSGKDRDVYVFFDNTAKVRAPFDAAALAARLGAGVSAKRPDDARISRQDRATTQTDLFSPHIEDT